MDTFEHALLEVAPGTTVWAFKDTALQLRERARRNSISTRAKLMRENRRMGLSTDRDGMSWMNLYLPAATAQGI